MALLHPAPTSSIHAGHHRRNTSELLRRPALLVHSPRRLRLHAQKGPGTGTGTPSGSESDNVVLKAAWYASEALGVAVSFFRPSPSAEGDAEATDEEASEQSLSTLGRAQVAEAIKDDFARSYFVTGNLTLRAYEEECEFADPAGSFRGLQRFKRNCTNFGSLLEKSDMKLTKWEDLQDKSTGHWRFSCVMSFPWRPISPQPGTLNTTSMLSQGRFAGICGELERPQDGTPEADIQAEQMGMGETLKTGAKICRPCRCEEA